MPVIYIIGDSTVEDNHPPFRGWGWALPEFAAPGVEVVNLALSGRSSKSFMAEGRFEPIRENIAAGDLLLIQFGHNDEKDDEERHTRPESTFPQYLNMFCDAALDKGALPALITPVSRRFFDSQGRLEYNHGDYPEAIRRLAKGRGLPLCDLKEASRALYLSLGPDLTSEMFVRLAPGEHPDFPDGHDDKTHFNAFGAGRIAALVADMLTKDGRCGKYFNKNKETVES